MLTEKPLVVVGTGSRDAIRRQLVLEFLSEQPGTGKRPHTSEYIYNVEQIADGRQIYLKRPARLNKGFDFEINVSNANFGVVRRNTMPSHPSIMCDLEAKEKDNPHDFTKVRGYIDTLYACYEVNNADMLQLTFTVGHPVEMVLKIIKWFFIEQDITYWNWSGRTMFYSGIQDRFP